MLDYWADPSCAGRLRNAWARRLALVTGAGVALRLAWLAYAAPVPIGDYAEYLRLAEGLLTSGRFGAPEPTAYRLPGYPAFLALAMLFGRSQVWLGLVNVGLSAAAIPLLAVLARRLTGSGGVALLAAGLAAGNPTFVYFAPVAASEHLYVVLLLAALVAAGGRPLLAGLCFGAAALTRADALFFLPVLLGWAFLAAPAAGRRGLRPALLVLLAAAAVVSPWLVRNRLVIGPGAGLTTNGGVNFYFAHNAREYGVATQAVPAFQGLSELARHRAGLALGRDYVAHAGAGALLRGVGRGTRALFLTSGAYAVASSTSLPQTGPAGPFPERPLAGRRFFEHTTRFYGLILLGAALSLAFAPALGAPAIFVLYGAVVCDWLGHAVVFFAAPRFRVVSELAFCVLAAFAAAALTRRWRARASPAGRS
jgi:hypothetical protein